MHEAEPPDTHSKAARSCATSDPGRRISMHIRGQVSGFPIMNDMHTELRRLNGTLLPQGGSCLLSCGRVDYLKLDGALPSKAPPLFSQRIDEQRIPGVDRDVLLAVHRVRHGSRGDSRDPRLKTSTPPEAGPGSVWN